MQPLDETAGLDRAESRSVRAQSADSALSHGNGSRMPRVLRRLVRAVHDRVPAGHFKRLGIIASAIFIGATLYLADENSLPGSVFATMSAEAGFSVSSLVINGNQHLGESDVKQQLEPLLGISLISLDVDDARERMAETRWVKAASSR
ncbi:MAG: FtsQ-type POTRA domain-containing protein, partial [Pseudomonadota bacterium]